jgi:carboxymethylenebutenolidase
MTELLQVTYPSGPGMKEIKSWWGSAGPGRRPTILILRGVAGPMDGYLRIAETVCGWGYNALVHNWQLRGNDPADEDIQADLAEAFKYLDHHPDVDPARIGLMGFCKGGTFAFFAASQRSSLIGIAVFHGFCRRKPSEDRLLQPFQLVDEMRAPMLFLHGTEDSQAPIHSMRELVASLRNRAVEVSLHEYVGVEHGFAVTTHPGYEPNPAKDSFERAQTFFAELLRAEHPRHIWWPQT